MRSEDECAWHRPQKENTKNDEFVCTQSIGFLWCECKASLHSTILEEDNQQDERVSRTHF